MKTVGLVIAKGHSRRLKEKNFRDFCGKPMFMWAVEKCLKVFDETYVSSDNDFILEEANENYRRRYDFSLTAPTVTVKKINNEYILTLTSHLTLDGQASPYIITDTGESSFFTKVRHLIDLLDKERY